MIRFRPILEQFASYLIILQSGDEVGKKDCRLVITSIQRDPAGRTGLAVRQPLQDQGRLSKTGRGGDEHQFVVQPFVEPFDEARPVDDFRPGWGDVKFGG